MITGLWRWWASFALAEFALIYCYPGYAVRADRAQSCHGRADRFGKGLPESRRALSSRWFCVNVLAAALVLQFMFPLYPQAKQYFDFVSSQGFVSGWSWVRNTAGFMIGGAPLVEKRSTARRISGMAGLLRGEPGLFPDGCFLRNRFDRSWSFSPRAVRLGRPPPSYWS